MIVLETVCVAFAMFSALPVPHVDWNERNMRYAMAAFPLVGAVIGALWCVCGLLPLPDMLKAAGFCLIPVAATGRHSSGRLCGYVRRAFQLWRQEKEAGDSQRPALRRVRGDPPVRLFRAVFRALRLSALYAARGRGLDAGARCWNAPYPAMRLRRSRWRRTRGWRTRSPRRRISGACRSSCWR